jgi:hypothetical protein
MMFAVIVWSLLAASVVGLAMYKKFLTDYKEDDLIHVGPGEEKLISQQMQTTKMIDFIDKWGQTLTIITVVSGLVLVCFYLYGVYLEGQKLVG